MRKLFGFMIAPFVIVALAIAVPAMGANPKAAQVVITKKCPAAASQKTYEGRVIVYVSGNGCVSIDKGAVAIASGNAVVAAHGDSSVVAKDRTTLIVYNGNVSCLIKGGAVTVMSAIRDRLERWNANCAPARLKH